MPKSRIAFALDYPSLDEARRGALAVREHIGLVKVGLELFVKEGRSAFAIAAECGVDLFADLKLHDIPETIERAIASVAASGARFVTVHAAGGAAMLARAVQRANQEAGGRMTVLAVTVLTSLDDADLAAQGITGRSQDHAVRLAHLAFGAGVRGFVCSPAEVRALRAELGPEVTLVTPGVRPAGATPDDQKRVASAADAIADGADIVVVGRPIRDAADPAASAREIAADVERGLARRTTK